MEFSLPKGMEFLLTLRNRRQKTEGRRQRSEVRRLEGWRVGGLAKNRRQKLEGRS